MICLIILLRQNGKNKAKSPKVIKAILTVSEPGQYRVFDLVV